MEQVLITNINKQEFVDIIEQTVKRVIGSTKPQIIDSREGCSDIVAFST